MDVGVSNDRGFGVDALGRDGGTVLQEVRGGVSWDHLPRWPPHLPVILRPIVLQLLPPASSSAAL